MDDSSSDSEEPRGRSSVKGSKRPVLLKGSRDFVKEKLHGKNFLIPSFITVVGIFCGFLAIVSAFRGQFEYATKCIGLAIILDGLDGRVARRLNATSAFGREFDSLSDLVTFGVAPAFLVYAWAFSSTVDEFGVLISFIFVVCAATRLARFNITTTGEMESKNDGSFDGLPSPGAAAAIAALVYCFPEPLQNQLLVSAMIAYTVFIAVMMVCTLPFLSLKHVDLAQGNPRVKIVALSILVALFWKYSHVMILIAASIYGASGFIALLLRRFTPKTWAKTVELVRANQA